MRAAIYVRVSSERQAGDDRVSPQAQLTDCREHCKKRGYTVTAELKDIKRYRSKGRLVNPSGTRKDRPGYLELLRMARDSDIDVIVAWKEDRLYRGLYAAMPLSEILDEKALDVDLVRETFDHKMLGIKASIGKMEIDNIKERMVMGRRARLERGELPGGPTKYGYWRTEAKKNAIGDWMDKVAYFCLLPSAVFLGVLIVFGAEWPINSLMNGRLGKDIDLPKKPAKMAQDHYDQLKEIPPPGGDLVGRFERALLFVALVAGSPALVGIWFAFKVASKWDAWSNIYQVPDTLPGVRPLDWFLIRKSFGARVYQRFLIGTAANFLAAAIGAGIIRGTISLIKHLS